MQNTPTVIKKIKKFAQTSNKLNFEQFLLLRWLKTILKSKIFLWTIVNVYFSSRCNFYDQIWISVVISKIRARETNNNNKFCEVCENFCKINPEGPCGPIGLEVVPIFLCRSWHQNNVKKFVNRVIFRNDILFVKQNK